VGDRSARSILKKATGVVLKVYWQPKDCYLKRVGIGNINVWRRNKTCYLLLRADCLGDQRLKIPRTTASAHFSREQLRLLDHMLPKLFDGELAATLGMHAGEAVVMVHCERRPCRRCFKCAEIARYTYFRATEDAACLVGIVYRQGSQ
jgi:hypothetical protein